MTERLANRLKAACRIAFLIGNLGLLWLFVLMRSADSAEDLPFTPTQGLWLTVLVALLIGPSLLLGAYLSFALGVDVFGLNRLSRIPRGKPFDGLAEGEEERLRLTWTRGGLGRGASSGFKLLLTNRRLLAGSSLTSWYLLEIPLGEIRLLEKQERRFGPPGLRFHLLGTTDAHRDLTLAVPKERARLEEELARLGLPSTS